MKMIDIHSHWGTRRGYTLRTDEELAQQKKTWNSEPVYATEDEMADHFRRSDVRAVLDFGFTKFIPLSEARRVHDYGFETQRAHPDVILGHWIHIDPHTGTDGVRELRRCIDNAPGFVGFAVSGSGSSSSASLRTSGHTRTSSECNSHASMPPFVSRWASRRVIASRLEWPGSVGRTQSRPSNSCAGSTAIAAKSLRNIGAGHPSLEG